MAAESANTAGYLPRSAERRRYAFVFVCQQGELEVKALLLAASLRRFLRCRYELIAAIPAPSERWGSPSDTTISMMQQMGVRLAPIINPAGGDYPIANKLAAVQVAVDADKLVFLDSDILCLRDFNDEPRFGLPVNLKPADHMTYSVDEGIWKDVYETAGVAFPSMRLPATTSQDFSLPYFNAGFIALDTGLHLPRVWEECYQRIRLNSKLADINSPPSRRAFWMDQVSLAVAISKLELPYDCLDERYNYPANLKPLDTERLPYFCHYHISEVIEQEPVLLDLVRSLVEQLSGIGKLLTAFPQWQFMRQPRRASATPARSLALLFGKRRVRFGLHRSATANLLITGIPRSGTSYLCNLLHHYSNCVVVNEPAELLQILATEVVPWSIPRLYRRLRSDICAGRPISNKLVQGKVTEDTFVNDHVCAYTPAVDDENFVLGTKNTIAYITRLECLRRVMPDARIVACIRNPFDTIASWKTSFPHLRSAEISGLPVGKENEPWLTGRQRENLLRIIHTGELAQRRALRWRYLAERLLEQGNGVTLVRYEHMVTEPERVVAAILDGMLKGRPRQPLRTSMIRSASHTLDDADRQAIRAICSQTAAALGL
jgi:hypothetical protein